jgi:hypothetical protein
MADNLLVHRWPHRQNAARHGNRHLPLHSTESSMKSASLLLLAALLLTGAPARAQDPKAGNPVMHTMGSLGAQGVFSTYMAIAELADLYGAKTYDQQKALQLAGAYAGLTEAAKESLSDLVDSGKLNSDDEAAVTQMIAINDLLGKTAQGIIAYIKDPTGENEASYDKNRQKAWNLISKFLGLGQ